jgi:SAM-dependent methyltransferase
VTRRLNDPDLVRAGYADESQLAARPTIRAMSTGPDPQRVALDAAAQVRPPRALEVSCGRGELAERVEHELGAHVVAVDRSERMVDLTRARGVAAHVNDVQDLPFDRWLGELARVLRPGGLLVANTNTELNMPELRGRFGQRAARIHGFGVEILGRHVARVERQDVRGTVEFPDREAACVSTAAPVTRRELAEELEPFDGPLVRSCRSVVFVAETAA